MKKIIFLAAIFVVFAQFLSAQENKMLIHNNGNVIFESLTTEIDSIKFKNNISYINLSIDNNNLVIPTSEIDSITFVESNEITPVGNIVYIFYNHETVTIINPFEEQGVDITVTAANVTINSTIYNVEYHVSGTTSDGSLTINSEHSTYMTLSNATITNSTGGTAISTPQSSDTQITIANNSINYLSDSESGLQSATLLSGGKLTFTGSGELSINGNKKHGISSSSDIIVNDGTFIIRSSSDGFHSEGFVLNNGSLDIIAESDAIDAGGTIQINNGNIKIVSTANDVKGIKSNDDLTINGGTIVMNISGAQSKGLSGKKDIIFNGGSTNIVTSGAAVLEESGSGYDPSYCTAVKSNGDIIVQNGNINIESKSTSDGGKGFSADGNISILGGNINITTAGNGTTYTDENGTTDSYTSCCIKSDLNISISGGTVNCKSTGKGGKGISADVDIIIGIVDADNSSLILDVTTSGERFFVSGYGQNADYANPKAIKSTGNLTINSGTITIKCEQSDEGGEGLESKNILTINGGKIEIQAYDDCINASKHLEFTGGSIFCASSGNDAIDSNGTLSISGGFIIANGTKAPEGGIDCDNNKFTITGGTIISTGGSTSNPTQNVSTQHSIIYNNATAGNSICIKNSNNEIILLFVLPEFTSGSNSGPGGPGGPGGGNSRMVVLFSCPDLTTGSYTLQYGGTISGGNTENGYNTNGTYSGGSSKSFNINSMVTTIN